MYTIHYLDSKGNVVTDKTLWITIHARTITVLRKHNYQILSISKEDQIMCKGYINETVEKHIRNAKLKLEDIANIVDISYLNKPSVRETNRLLVQARAYINDALRAARRIERVRYVRPNKKEI